MESITQYVERRLKLKVNRQKSAVDLAKKRRLLGFRFYGRGEVKVRIDPGARTRAKDRLRQLTSRKWGVSMEQRITEINRYTVGWTNYHALADTPSVFEGLDEWLRHRLRQVRWKEWKRANARRRNLITQGISVREATEWSHSRKGYWRVSGSPILTRALPNAYWAEQGLKGFSDPFCRFRDASRTAGCGPARPVVWEAPG
jgi:RNA-directed DNA polymerase